MKFAYCILRPRDYNRSIIFTYRKNSTCFFPFFLYNIFDAFFLSCLFAWLLLLRNIRVIPSDSYSHEPRLPQMLSLVLGCAILSFVRDNSVDHVRYLFLLCCCQVFGQFSASASKDFPLWVLCSSLRNIRWWFKRLVSRYTMNSLTMQLC